MRPVFIIGIYFFVVIMFPYIPLQVRNGNKMVLIEGFYPALWAFAACCAGSVALALLISYRRFKKPMKGVVLLRRKDLNLRYLLPVLSFWVAFIAFAQFVLSRFIESYQRLGPYLLIILISFVVYELIWKQIIAVMKPDFVSFHSDAFHIRNFFGDEKRDLADLSAIRYRPRMNCIVLKFQDQMERKKLFLGDYEHGELQALIDFVNKEAIQAVRIDPMAVAALQNQPQQ